MWEKEKPDFSRRWTLAAFLLCSCFVVGSIIFLSHMASQHTKENMEFLDNAAKQHETALVKQVEGDFQTLHGVAVFIGEQDITDLEEIVKLVTEVNEGNVFIRMGFVTLEGNLELMELGGKHYQGLNVSNEVFFQRAAAGEDIISKAVPDTFRKDGQYINYYAVPVENKLGEIVGVLCAVNDAQIMREIIDAPLLDGTGYTDLYDSEGKMILRSVHSPVEENLSLYGLPDIQEDEQIGIRKVLSENGKAHITYTIDGEAMLAVLEPAGIEDWFILSTVSIDVLRQRYVITAIGAGTIIMAACALFMLLLFQQRRMMTRNQVMVERLAYVDELTGGRNYNKFLLDAEEARRVDVQQAIWFCDMKKFKYYNDALGYQKGDEMLCRMYGIIAHLEGNEGIFCRMMADNFVGIKTYTDRHALTQWFEVLLDELHREESETASRSYLELCMGFYCLGPEDAHLTINEMVNRANMAQKSVKELAGSSSAFFNETLRQHILQEALLESQGQTALVLGQFQPYFQPKYDIQHNDRLTGAEVLCRWIHPEKGMISPANFIPVFEKSGLIVQLDRYMFRKACEWYRGYLDQGGHPINLAVNVSRVGLLREDFVAYYAAVKQEFALPDYYIELEMTESLALGGEELLHQLANELQSNGFICSLDDFGSGYSSLNLLKNLPINVLKLDVLFFRQSRDKRRERIVVRNIINMAKELKICVVAEGVEERESLEFLRDAGCDTVQGYIFAKPMPLEAFNQLLSENKR